MAPNWIVCGYIMKDPPPQEILRETFFREMDIFQEYTERETIEIWVIAINVSLINTHRLKVRPKKACVIHRKFFIR